jgi:N utilization substance protein B
MIDTRHQKRIQIVQDLYSLMFQSHIPESERTAKNEKVQKIWEQKDTISDHISKYAPRFPINQIAKVDLAILQLSIYELLYEKKQPPKVIINEAVELAKELGGERSFAFINAVLGKVLEQLYVYEK